MSKCHFVGNHMLWLNLKLLHAALAFIITSENLYLNVNENICIFSIFGWIFTNVSLKF